VEYLNQLFFTTHQSLKDANYIYTMILCCPCYMPNYVPRLEGIMHDPKSFFTMVF